MKRTGFRQQSIEEIRRKQIEKNKLNRLKLKEKKIQSVLKKKERKIKYENLRTIEKRVWELCKQIVRQTCINIFGYLRCYTCKKTITDLADAHTGHWRKKSILSIRHKYDLRGLRVQCAHCNKYLDGNEAEYTLNLIREVGEQTVFDLDKEFKEARNQPIGSADARILLQNMEDFYEKELAKLRQ